MSILLTDNQKSLARWLVQQIRDGKISEEFLVVWIGPEVGSESGLMQGIIHQTPNHPHFTKGMLDALEELLKFTPNYETTTEQVNSFFGPQAKHRQVEVSRTCTITANAYEAIDSDFAIPSASNRNQVSIGAIIQSMSGGNIQAIGIAQDAEISQIINDPELLRSQVEALTKNLLNEVKSELKVDELQKYAQSVQELKEQLTNKQPDNSVIRRLIRTLSLLGDVEGSIALMTRVWSLLYPLILILAARLSD